MVPDFSLFFSDFTYLIYPPQVWAHTLLITMSADATRRRCTHAPSFVPSPRNTSRQLLFPLYFQDHAIPTFCKLQGSSRLALKS